jgi:hypothetical protein
MTDCDDPRVPVSMKKLEKKAWAKKNFLGNGLSLA